MLITLYTTHNNVQQMKITTTIIAY